MCVYHKLSISAKEKISLWEEKKIGGASKESRTSVSSWALVGQEGFFSNILEFYVTELLKGAKRIDRGAELKQGWISEVPIGPPSLGKFAFTHPGLWSCLLGKGCP